MNAVPIVLAAWFVSTAIAAGALSLFAVYLDRRRTRQIAARRAQRPGYLRIVPNTDDRDEIAA
jgi:hypothetical protein